MSHVPMSLYPYGARPSAVVAAFRNPWAEIDQVERALCPYLANSSLANLGETLGEVTNTKDKYAVAVDVSHFAPEEIKVR